LWCKAPLRDHLAARIEFVDVHGATVPDMVAGAGVGPAATMRRTVNAA
jgi:hypothetical protein